MILEDVEEDKFTEKINLKLKPQIKIIKSKKINRKTPSLMSDISLSLYCFKLVKYLSGDNKTDSFIKDMEEDLKKSNFFKSIYDFRLSINDEEFFFKVYGYVRILRNKNNDIFKLNYFLDYFQSLLKGYGMNINYMIKEEMYILVDGFLKTPLEIV